MEAPSKSAEDIPDPDFFNNTKAAIEKELEKMKKIVNNINQMRAVRRPLLDIGLTQFGGFAGPTLDRRPGDRSMVVKCKENAAGHSISPLVVCITDIIMDQVEAAYLESDLVLMIDAPTWQEISELIGIGTSPMTMDDVVIKKEM